jgi:preprotein translocase subunit SecE
MLTKARTFFNEVRIELAKASWPWDPKLKGAAKYKELIDSTVVVVIAMIIIGAFVSLSDIILVTVLNWLVKISA